MTELPERSALALRSHRDSTIQLLCAEFASDKLTLEEFERRLDAAHRASAPADLDALTADLRAPAAAPRAAPPAETGTEHQLLVAVMSGVERRGFWVPARKTHVLAVMGGVELDFREARLPDGVTEVNVACCMGGVEITVAPGTTVEVGGIAFMGAFPHFSNRAAQQPGPVLKITGFALMGGVEIDVREVGESRRAARQRSRAERRPRRRNP